MTGHAEASPSPRHRLAAAGARAAERRSRRSLAPAIHAGTGRQFVVLRPHLVLLPEAAIFVVVLALNLVGDALRDALDPRAATC